MAVEEAILLRALPRVAGETEGNGINIQVAVVHDGLAAAGSIHAVDEIGAAGFISNVNEFGFDAALFEPVLEVSHAVGLVGWEALKRTGAPS